MNLKKNIIKKIACVALSTILTISAIPHLTYAHDFIDDTNIQLTNNMVEQNNLILNGDFSEGLNYWAGEAEIISQNGMNYAMVSNGAPISQTVRVKPYQNYELKYSTLAGTNFINGIVTVIGLTSSSPGSYEILLHEEISSAKNLDMQDHILRFSTTNISGVIVLVIPYMDTNFIVNNISLVEAS